MIRLKDKPNVVAPDPAPFATYPYGRIKDDSGVGDGTPVNEYVHMDFHQFFEALMEWNGTHVADGNPDGGKYGQIYAALLATIENRYILGPEVVMTLINGWAAGARSPKYQLLTLKKGTDVLVPNVQICFLSGDLDASLATNDIFSNDMPRSKNIYYFPCHRRVSASVMEFYEMQILNGVTQPNFQDRAAMASGSVVVKLDTISYLTAT